ncbi:retrovirus-related pol polyprotein from transposon TNT 1-94 [Tanacetum coccineum]
MHEINLHREKISEEAHEFSKGAHTQRSEDAKNAAWGNDDFKKFLREDESKLRYVIEVLQYASHKAKNIVSTTRCLELLHMDLFGPSAVRSYEGNRYTLVIVDDYSRYTLTRFLKDKTEAFDQFKVFSKKIQNHLGCTIVSIRIDHRREFDNEVQFGEFCNDNGITHNFSAPRTPQSNGVVERKNKTLQEISRTMLNE